MRGPARGQENAPLSAALPEYLPSAASHLLLVLAIRDAGLAPEIAGPLGRLGQVRVRSQGEGAELVFLAQAAGPSRAPLQLLDQLLGGREEGGRLAAAVEIVETRLVPKAVGKALLAQDGPGPPAAAAAMLLPAHDLRIQAGAAFGSGSHPSTRLAITALEELARPGPLPSPVLDVGCGSGILSLVAARLGASEVLGIDVCAQSLAAAQLNRQQNRLQDRVTFSGQPLATIPRLFPLVVANLAISVLQRLLPEIVRHSAAGGHLIVSGCQGRQGERLRALVASRPVTPVAAFREDGWHALLLRHSPGS
ncbi:MAG: 50S ribosomal protein L11 methyltransferase [Thermodesulfobacteriota bacterium]